MKKYLVARPETICAILQEGKLPKTLPAHLGDLQLYLFDSPVEAAINSTSDPHQTFVVQLDFSSKSGAAGGFVEQKKRTFDGGKCLSVPVAAIERVICYSAIGKKILTILANDNPVPPIVVDALLMSTYNPPSSSSSSVDDVSYPPDAKRTKTTVATNAASWFQSRSPDRQVGVVHKGGALIQRITTPSGHIALLKQALITAKKSLLITTYGIHHQALQKMGFYAALSQASARGVKIYIYFNDRKGADGEAVGTLRSFANVKCEETFTHSKFLCVDHQWVSIGSFNWLASVRESAINEQTEGSLVSYQQALNKDLLKDIWTHLRFYRNIQFDNSQAVQSFQNSEDSYTTSCYELDNHSELEYIPSLNQHSGFLQEMMAQAKHKIVICSPFLSMTQFFADIDNALLRSLAKKGVTLFIVTSSQSQHYSRLVSYLRKMKSDFIRIIDHQNFHQKTLIVDDEMIAEGSFNWLSAVRDEGSKFHNHEATMVVKGRAASGLIEQFYASSIGKKVSSDQVVNCVNAANDGQSKMAFRC